MSSSASPLLAIRLGHLLYRYADRHAVTHTTHCRQRLLVTAGSPLACCKHPLPASRCTAKRPLPTSPTVRCCRLSLLASSPLCPAAQYTRTRSAHTTHCKSESTAHTSQTPAAYVSYCSLLPAVTARQLAALSCRAIHTHPSKSLAPVLPTLPLHSCHKKIVSGLDYVLDP